MAINKHGCMALIQTPSSPTAVERNGPDSLKKYLVVEQDRKDLKYFNMLIFVIIYGQRCTVMGVNTEIYLLFVKQKPN